MKFRGNRVVLSGTAWHPHESQLINDLKLLVISWEELISACCMQPIVLESLHLHVLRNNPGYKLEMIVSRREECSV